MSNILERRSKGVIYFSYVLSDPLFYMSNVTTKRDLCSLRFTQISETILRVSQVFLGQKLQPEKANV